MRGRYCEYRERDINAVVWDPVVFFSIKEFIRIGREEVSERGKMDLLKVIWWEIRILWVVRAVITVIEGVIKEDAEC